MSAGLPGLGLGGLFFIFSALLAPVPELWKTLRGRSGLAAWRVIGRQFAQAVAMVAAIDLTIRLVYVGLSVAGLGDPPPADSGTVLPLTLVGITSALLAAVIGTAKLAELALRIRTADLPRVPDALPRPAPLRTLAIGGIVTLTWFTLLAGGASELSPLVKPRGDRTAEAEQRAEGVQESPSSPAGPAPRQVAEVPSVTPTVNPSAAEGRPLVANTADEGNAADHPALKKPIQLPPTAQTPMPPQEQSPVATAPSAIVAPPAPADSRGEPPPATPPKGSAPPATAGPLEGGPGPDDQAGQPPLSGPPGSQPPTSATG